MSEHGDEEMREKRLQLILGDGPGLDLIDVGEDFIGGVQDAMGGVQVDGEDGSEGDLKEVRLVGQSG